MRIGPSAVVSVSPQLVFAVNFLLVTRIRIMPHPRIPVLEALLHRGDSGAEIIDQELVQGGQHVGSQLTIEYPTVFHIYDVAQLCGDSPDQIQYKLHTAARTKLHAMKIQPPSRNPVNANARGTSDIVKYWHALTGRGTETQSDSHHAGNMCAPQLWCKSATELFHEARGQLEACEYLPTLLAPVVKLPRYLNAIMRMLLNKQALESHGIFRLAAANDAAAMNRWFDWIERNNNNNNNNVPEYGAIPNLSPLDFAVLLKRWMSSHSDEDRLVPTACSRAIHALMDQYAADLCTANQQLFKNALRCMLQCLDLHRLSVLACILHVVQGVIAKANCNSMDGENLAKMLAPSMFAFGQVSSIDAYDWAILALTVIFAEKDITWWFLPVS